jgi:hypothetical protein
MDALHLAIALGPVAAYLFLLGAIILRPRPFVTTGARDLLALGIACLGLVVAGPLELFLPEAAASLIGAWVWLPLIGLYASGLILLVLTMPPRLVIYNVSLPEARALLERCAAELDPTARWAGDSVALPGVGIQLYLNPFARMRTVQLLPVGPEQNFAGWRRLEQVVQRAAAGLVVSPNSLGLTFLFLALMIGGMITAQLLGSRQELDQALRDMLRV